MHSYLFVFFFGQSKGKADKFYYIINMLDVLRESLILVSGLVHLPGFYEVSLFGAESSDRLGCEGDEV
jgi:hypothetical protein